jgi:hypothetical protein
LTRAGRLILVVMAVAGCSLGPNVSPTAPTASPTASPVAPASVTPTPLAPATAVPGGTASPAPTTAASSPAGNLEWARITAAEQPDLGEPGTSVFLRAVAAWDQDLVAVGEMGGRGAMAWFSGEGYQWTRAEDLPASPDSRMLDVRLGHTGFVAVGRDAGSAAVWLSPDGRGWTHAEVADGDGAEFRAVTSWRGGFAAIGATEDKDGEGVETAGIWTSADGRAWEMLAPGSGLDGTTNSITAALDRRLVVAGERLDENGEWGAGVWISDDGVEWTVATDPALAWSGIRDVLSVADELVAVGYTRSEVGLRAPAAWQSFDGLTWQALELPGASESRDVFLTSIGPREGGFAAVGSGPNGSVAVWTTSDLSDWSLIEGVDGLDSPPETLGTYEPADVVGSGSRVVIVGWYPRLDPGTTWSGAVWTNLSPPAGYVPAVTPEPAPCPTDVAVDVLTVIDLEPASRIECFGGGDLRFVAHVDGADGVDLTGQPAWLLGAAGLMVSPVEGGQHVGGAVMPVHPAPQLEIGDSVFEHHWYVVTGHFDDPRAQTCRPAAGVALSVEEAITRCRQRFVVTALEATDPPSR